jgi:hypothetical protein
MVHSTAQLTASRAPDSAEPVARVEPGRGVQVGLPTVAHRASPLAVLSMQRAAGNRATAGLLQRSVSDPGGGASVVQRQADGGAADAGTIAGAPPQAVPAQAGQPADPPPTPAESAPVELPAEGDLQIVFSATPRHWKLDTKEIDKLKIGKGKVSTPPIPAGEWLSVAAEVGEESGAKVTAGLTLSPIRGEITAAKIAAVRPSHQTAGAIGAAIGGIQGGLIGGGLGALAGGMTGGVLGLPGAVAGAAGGGAYGAKTGAGMLGVAYGKGAERLAGMFDGRYDIEATLLEGSLTGSLGLHYEPYFKLKLSATGFSWLADLEAILRTKMDLRLAPGASLAKSSAKLTFDSGRLVRSEFTLSPELRLQIGFDAMATLAVALRLLPFMDESKFPEAGRAKTANAREISLLQSNPFKLFGFNSTHTTKSTLKMAKGSPLELLDSLLGLDDALSMTNLLPDAIKGGNGEHLPSAGSEPQPGSPGTDPLESDFNLKPGDRILVRSTGRFGGRIGWFRGEVKAFERIQVPGDQSGRTQLFLVYEVQFPDQPATLKTEGASALNDLRKGAASERLRSYQDSDLLETLQPLLDDPLLDVGPNGSGSIPASGPVPSKIERDLIQPIGNASGCHIAAGHSTGGKSWVADHQRPTALVDHGALKSPGPQRLYPMCPSDSVKQGVLVRKILRMWLGRVP